MESPLALSGSVVGWRPTTADSVVRVDERRVLDWPLFAGAGGPVEGLVVRVRASDRETRLAAAGVVGPLFMGTVREHYGWGSVWFLSCLGSAYARGSSGFVRASRSPFSVGAGFVGAAVGWEPAWMSVVDTGEGDVRLAAAFCLDGATSARAVQAMVTSLGVGVLFRSDPGRDHLEHVMGLLFAGGGVSVEGFRQVALRRLLVEHGGVCDAVMTVSGVFDDREFAVEHFRRLDERFTESTP